MKLQNNEHKREAGSPETIQSPGPWWRSDLQTSGLLAQSLAYFVKSGGMRRSDVPTARGYLPGIRTPIVVNNKGLHFCLPLLQLDFYAALITGGDAQVVLACRLSPGVFATIILRDISANGGRHVRVNAHFVDHLSIEKVQDKSTFRNVTTETRIFNKGARPIASIDWVNRESQEAADNDVCAKMLRQLRAMRPITRGTILMLLLPIRSWFCC